MVGANENNNGNNGNNARANMGRTLATLVIGLLGGFLLATTFTTPHDHAASNLSRWLSGPNNGDAVDEDTDDDDMAKNIYAVNFHNTTTASSSSTTEDDGEERSVGSITFYFSNEEFFSVRCCFHFSSVQ